MTTYFPAKRLTALFLQKANLKSTYRHKTIRNMWCNPFLHSCYSCSHGIKIHRHNGPLPHHSLSWPLLSRTGPFIYTTIISEDAMDHWSICFAFGQIFPACTWVEPRTSSMCSTTELHPNPCMYSIRIWQPTSYQFPGVLKSMKIHREDADCHIIGTNDL